MSTGSKVIAQTDKHTDRQTDTTHTLRKHYLWKIIKASKYATKHIQMWALVKCLLANCIVQQKPIRKVRIHRVFEVRIY